MLVRIKKSEELSAMANHGASVPATAASLGEQSLRKRTWRLFPPTGDEQCTAWVFLAATGVAERCRYRRRQETLCSRHFRDRFDSDGD